MSYAAAASKNRLPLDQQPHPDQSLLEGEHHTEGEQPDLSHSADEKVHTVTREEFDAEHSALHADAPAFVPKHFSEADAPDAAPAVRQVPVNQSGGHGHQLSADAQKEKDEVEAKAQRDAAAVKQKAQEAEKAAEQKYSEVKKDVSKDVDAAKQKAGEYEKVAEKKYENAKEEVSKDAEIAKKKAAEVGKTAEKKFEKGKEEAKKEYDELSEKARNAYNKLSKEAQEDWHKLSKESKKQWEAAKDSDVGRELQKPEVWGSLLGVANVAVLGSLAYFTYVSWPKPRWDRRVVSATVLGVSTWFGLQGYLLPQTDAVRQQQRRY